MNVPEAVGVPLIVMVLLAQAAVTPAGRSVGVPMPVAPVVVCTMSVNGVLMHKDGVEDAGPTVLSAFTVMVPVAFALPQPPVSGMV